MARGYFSKLNPRRLASSKRPKPLGESRQRVPRVGGRAALVASSAARFERMEAKAHRAGRVVVTVGNFVDWLRRKFGPPEFKPKPASNEYRGQV